jgi:predicted small secreted protein
MERRIAILWLVAVLLAGCSNTGAWTKPGAGPADIAAALQQCRTAADRAVGPEEGINEDIEATRGTDWERSQIGSVARAELGAETRGRADRIVASCMHAHGFVRAR